MEYPIDVTIYLQGMRETIVNEGILDDIMQAEEMNDSDLFTNLIMQEIELHSLGNFNKDGDPELDEEQFEQSIAKGFALYHLTKLADKGLVEPCLNDDMELAYKLTEAGQEIADLMID